MYVVKSYIISFVKSNDSFSASVWRNKNNIKEWELLPHGVNSLAQNPERSIIWTLEDNPSTTLSVY